MSLLEKFPQLPACCLCVSLRGGALATSVYMFIETALLIAGKGIFLTLDNAEVDGVIFWNTFFQVVILHAPQLILTIVLFIGAIKSFLGVLVDRFKCKNIKTDVHVYWNDSYTMNNLLSYLTLSSAIRMITAKIQLIAFYSWITLLLIIIEFFLLAVGLMAYPREGVYFILIFGFHIYLWLCVNSYFLALKDEVEVAYKRKFDNVSMASVKR